MDGEGSEIRRIRAGIPVSQFYVRVEIGNGQLVERAAGQRNVEESTALFDVANDLIDDFGW